MTKKSFAIILAVIFLSLCVAGCTQKPKVDDRTMLELPGIKWGATPEEVKENLKLTDDQIIDDCAYGEGFWRLYITNVPFFGKEVSFGQFTFRCNPKNGEFALSSVDLYYPSETDMTVVKDALIGYYGTPKNDDLGFTRYKVTEGTVKSYQDPGPSLAHYEGQEKRLINRWESAAMRADVLPADVEEAMISSGLLMPSGTRAFDPGDPAARTLTQEYLQKDPAVLLCCTDSAKVAGDSQYYTKNLVSFDAHEYIWALQYHSH